MDRTRITSVVRGSDGRLYSDGRRVICHSADRPEIERELATQGYSDVYLGERRGRGRPALDDGATVTISARVPESIRTAMIERAEEEGETVGVEVRRALARYIGDRRDMNGVIVHLADVESYTVDPTDTHRTILTMRSGRRLLVMRALFLLQDTPDMPTSPARWLDPA